MDRGDGDSDNDKPVTPIHATGSSETRTVTVEQVSEQSDAVVRAFIQARYRRQQFQEMNDGIALTPRANELETINTLSPLNPSVMIGQRVADMGDQIYERYQGDLQDMVATLGPIGPDTAYSSFAEVAAKLFDGREIHWGRIMALLMFGYQLSINLVRQGCNNFLNIIVRYLIKFIAGNQIAGWIANHGGWNAMLHSSTLNVTGEFLNIPRPIIVLCVGVVVSIVVYSWITRS